MSYDAPCADMEPVHLLFSSAASGFMVGFLCTPFDVVKNFWQFNSSLCSHRTALSSSKVALHIYHRTGFLSFWTGVIPTIGVIVPSNIIFFYLYESMKQYDTPSWAGIKARTTAVVITAPIEFLRTKLQADMGTNKSLQILKKSISEEGIGSLWRGALPTLIRDVPFSAAYWELNEFAKSLIKKYDHSYHHRSSFVSQFVYPFLSGGCSAAVACSLTHPFDVIKTHMQATNRIRHENGYIYMRRDSMRTISRRIYKSEGFRGFTVGIGPRIAKIVPACAILLGTYDLSKSLSVSPTTPKMD